MEEARGYRHLRISPACAADDVEDDIAEPDPVEVSALVRAAVAYLRDCKPGKRVTALLALYRAATGMETFDDWRWTEARRTWAALRAPTRSHLHMVVRDAAHIEPRFSDKLVFQTVAGRFNELDTGFIGKRKRIRRGRPTLTVVK